MTRKMTAADFGPPEGEEGQPEDLEPGGWGGSTLVDMQPRDEAPREVTLSSPEDLEQRYRLAADTLDLHPAVVYHPCSGSYITPSVVFPDAHVIYAETDSSVATALRVGGYEVHETSATEFTPDVPVDLLILLNPSIHSKGPARSVRSGGYVFTNDYHGNASELKGDENFELAGVVVLTREGYRFDQTDLAAYFQEVETDEEWRNSRPGFSLDVMSYEEAVAAMKDLAPDAPNVLDGYRRILDQARVAYHDQMVQVLGGEEACGLSADPSTQVQFMMSGHILSVALPNKKGGVDDIFVFRKK